MGKVEKGRDWNCHCGAGMKEIVVNILVFIFGCIAGVVNWIAEPDRFVPILGLVISTFMCIAFFRADFVPAVYRGAGVVLCLVAGIYSIVMIVVEIWGGE